MISRRRSVVWVFFLFIVIVIVIVVVVVVIVLSEVPNHSMSGHDFYMASRLPSIDKKLVG